MDQVKVGKFIAMLRKELGYTQEDLAKKLNVSNKSISRWENGNTMPDLSLIPKLCEILNISINELFSGERIEKGDYQKKLEENIIINIGLLKNKLKQIIKRLVIGIAISFIVLIIGILCFIGYKEYTYTKVMIPDNNIEIKACSYKDMIGIKISTKDNTPFIYNSYYNKETKTEIIEEVFRYIYEDNLKDYTSSTTTIIPKEIEKILYKDKEIYIKGDLLEPCN